MSFWQDNFWTPGFWANDFWIGLSTAKKHTVAFESSSSIIEFVGAPQRVTDFESSSRTIEFSST